LQHSSVSLRREAITFYRTKEAPRISLACPRARSEKQASEALAELGERPACKR